MNILSLELTNYRNYSALGLDFPARGAIISGDNGRGKTNLLEAIYFLAFGKSFRTPHDQQLINFNSDYFLINSVFNKNDQEYHISAAANSKNKVLKINNRSLEKLSELYNYLKVVYFSPADLDIIYGSPSNRRLFLDQAISQYDPLYLDNLKQFRQILKQRNALLKQSYSKAEKKSWDEQFVSSSSMIIRQRQKYLQEFVPVLMKLYRQFIQEKESIELKYKYSMKLTKDNYTQDLTDFLAENEAQEKLAQRTLAGAHLDDLDFYIDQCYARNYASQGQARSLVIITRLVQALLISQNNDEKPILMFDDVLSELDDYRTRAILDLLNNNFQIFIATPSMNSYHDLNLEQIDLMKFAL